mgnify:CR=1 FL=1
MYKRNPEFPKIFTMRNVYPPKTNSPVRRLKRGFSLIEMLIVIALIAMLAGLVVTNLDKLFGGGQEKIARIFVKESIKAPLFQFRTDMGNYPTTEQGLQALYTAPSGAGDRWRGPYVEELPRDPWENPYQYRSPGERNPDKYDIWSLGPDGKKSDDDIGNW